MNHIRWAAWGVVDIEHMPTDMAPGKGTQRQARRNYLKKVHAELAELGYSLHPGGSTNTPYYMVMHDLTANKHTAAGQDAFKKVCAWVLEKVGDHTGAQDVSGQDGGVRRAGDEA